MRWLLWTGTAVALLLVLWVGAFCALFQVENTKDADYFAPSVRTWWFTPGAGIDFYNASGPVWRPLIWAWRLPFRKD